MMNRLGAILGMLIFVIPADAAVNDVELPVPIQQYQQIRYYSAGVSVEERRELPQLFPLKMVFSTDQGHMLCDAEVNITQGGKIVFRGIAQNGPWLIVDLQPGVYDIDAVQDGKTKSVKGVQIISGKKRTVSFKWKSSDVNMGL